MDRRVLVLLIIAQIASTWVIYKRNHKKKLICKEETEWTNSTSEIEEVAPLGRLRRDIPVDPESKEPIIYLGGHKNKSDFIDDGDFDIVSDHLTKEELAQVKQQIIDTCNALNSN